MSPAVASQQTIRSSPPVLPDDSIIVLSPPPELPTAAEEVNPWLQIQKSTVTQSRRKNEILIGKDSAGADKSKNQMKKRLLKGDEEREKARKDAVVEISMDEVLTLPGAQQGQTVEGKSEKTKGKEKAPPNGNQVDAAFDDSDAESEVEAQEQQIKVKSKGKGVKAFEQRDLVALAFAGDNVVQVPISYLTMTCCANRSLKDFEKLKRSEVEANAPRDEDHTLPGWVR